MFVLLLFHVLLPLAFSSSFCMFFFLQSSSSSSKCFFFLLLLVLVSLVFSSSFSVSPISPLASSSSSSFSSFSFFLHLLLLLLLLLLAFLVLRRLLWDAWQNTSEQEIRLGQCHSLRLAIAKDGLDAAIFSERSCTQFREVLQARPRSSLDCLSSNSDMPDCTPKMCLALKIDVPQQAKKEVWCMPNL